MGLWETQGISNITGKSIGTHKWCKITGIWPLQLFVLVTFDLLMLSTAQCLQLDVSSLHTNEIFQHTKSKRWWDMPLLFGSRGNTSQKVFYKRLEGGRKSVGRKPSIRCQKRNSDAYFIFKFGGAFTTEPSTTIKFEINGALSE